MKLGVCYYPEQWDDPDYHQATERADRSVCDVWIDDARRMAEIGISHVRIGEFAWSRIEPEPGLYEWRWLDEVLKILANAGLKVILGTPTATPPKWLIDQYPDCLARDHNGQIRKFGSRRHYCFSSRRYRLETTRIVTAMSERYGKDVSIVGWQTDNEYGCHDTVRSYSDEALLAFRLWLEKRYVSIANLNSAWGTVFWSQTYRNFDEIDLPNLTVTEPNPAHVLDFYRFSSDQVVAYNRLQTDIIRARAPDCDIYHNFMGHFTDFDHFAVGRDIDVAAWDSYPLGFLDQEQYQSIDKQDFLRQGHPDFAGFHHDLYRACGNGRMAIMEQQPGPVNWAPNNPAPLPGMVRLWGHETRAHGGELFSVFRWRQAPYAQENMHAAIIRRDNQPAPAYEEIRQLADDITATPLDTDEFQQPARIGLIFSYETQWMSQIKPQGASWDYLSMAMNWYKSARQLGHNIDIVEPGTNLNNFDVVLIPSLMHISPDALASFQQTDAQLIFGPRTGSFTQDMQIPENLAPGPLQELIPLKVAFSESFPPDHAESGMFDDLSFSACTWLDHMETSLPPIAATKSGIGLVFNHNNITMLTSVPSDALVSTLVTKKLQIANSLHRGLRTNTGKTVTYQVNYGPQNIMIDQSNILIDGQDLPTGGVALSRNSK